jgi:uncharacterized protein
MRNLTTTICLAVALLLGSAGVSWSQDLGKGYAAYQTGDYATALREWTPLAKQGYALVQFNLGMMYNKGRGVPQNYKTAVNPGAKRGQFPVEYRSILLVQDGPLSLHQL